MHKIKTIIVDDEKKSRDGLQRLLLDSSDFHIEQVCKDGVEAIESIDKINPDLLLLDIQMPGISGFDVLKSIAHRPFIIFITAYDQYSLKAFEFHALDYLLKPFTNERFYDAINNASQLIRTRQLAGSLKNLNELINRLKNESSRNEAIPATNNIGKLVIRTGGKIVLIKYDHIRWIEGYDYYVKIHEKETHIIKNSMKNLEETLPSHFVRIHKSSIINLQSLQRLDPLSHSELAAVLDDGTVLKVSRNYKKNLINQL